MKEQDSYQLIDSYLNGELNADEKLAVESRIQSDPEFAETFSILEKVYVKIEDKGALDLMLRLNELSEQYPADEVDLNPEQAPPKVSSTATNTSSKTSSTPPSSSEKPGGMWKLLLPLLLVGAAGLFYFFTKGETTKPEIPKVNTPTTTPNNNTTPPKVETPVDKTIEEQTPVKKKEPEQKASPKKEEKPKPKYYAAADFEVNEMLDKMIGTTTRSDLSFEVTAPKLNQNFPETTTTITFSGTTNSTETQKGSFRLLNNKRIDISQQDINATDSFKFSAKIPKPGLYYYTVKIGSKTYVGKFTVGKK